MKGMPGEFLSCNVVATYRFSSYKNRQLEEKLRILSLIRDQRTKYRETREQLKKGRLYTIMDI